MKTIQTFKASNRISINGVLDDDAWSLVEPASNFIERNPQEGRAPSQKTEVKILYDENSIFVGVVCFDKFPDSILTQLGERDDRLNADVFKVYFDTYNTKLDAFSFGVTASGVQLDSRLSDNSFNAVWNSKVKITDVGWVIEMEIPYSALRFPKQDSQNWNIQFEREIRRHRQELQWAPVPKNAENQINFWGKLDGLENIKAPLRLAFMPYTSLFNQSQGKSSQFGYGGGADMKLGLNESFTLDMTLVPDFSQARSDNIVKNLGAFEVVFDEQRQFFQEGVDIFSAGELFYSRRIGSRPINYSSNYFGIIDSSESIVSNPQSTNILNVTKVSGRDKNGLGIGVLNGVTGTTYAIFEDTLGIQRKHQISPSTNYNIVALNQNLKNNGSLYFVNTWVSRGAKYRNANVSATGLSLSNEKNTHNGQVGFKVSQIFDTSKTDDVGLSYSMAFGKIRGKFKYKVSSEGISPKYDPNDMGVNFKTNIRKNNVELKYNEYNPFWKLNNAYNTLTLNVNQYYDKTDILLLGYQYKGFFTLPSFNSFFIEMGGQNNALDLFESRVPGQIFINPWYTYFQIGVSMDYRKPFVIDGHIGRGFSSAYGGISYRKYKLAPIFRLSDKFTLRPSTDVVDYLGGVGAGFDENYNLVYGQRDVLTVTNLIEGKYLFMNNLSLTLRFRHYWSTGKYRYFGNLDSGGWIIQDDNIIANADFNFNAFNTDIVFAWQYGPGSFLNIVFKTALQQDEQMLRMGYSNNLNNVLESDQLNTLTVKLIYYLDVGRIIKKRDI